MDFYLPPKPAIIIPRPKELVPPSLSMLMVTQLIGFGVTGDSGKSLTFTDNAINNTDLSTYTFSTRAIGTATADRVVIVGIGFSNGSTLSSCTIGGTGTTTIASSTADAAQKAYLVAAVITSGTTADIVVTTAAGVNRCGIGVWAAYGLSGTTAVDSDFNTASPSTNTLSTVPGGFAVAYVHPSAGPNSWSGTGVSERFDDAMESGLYSSGADAPTDGTNLAMTATHGAANRAMVCASW